MSQKNQDSLKKKFDKIIKLSKKNQDGVHTIAMTSEKALAQGLGPDQINPPTALFFSNIEGISFFNGFIDSTPLSQKHSSDLTLVGIDNQDLKKPSIYIRNGDVLSRFNNRTELQDDEKILLYWEYGPYSCFFFVIKDPLTQSTLLDCIFSESFTTQKANRFFFLSLLPIEEKKIAISLFKESFDRKNAIGSGGFHEDN